MNSCIVLILVMGLLTPPQIAFGKKEKAITLHLAGRYSAGAGGTRAEIAAYDPDTRRIFAVDLALLRVDVIDVSNPAAPELEFTIPLAGAPNSVAVRDGVVAVAIENAVKTSPGLCNSSPLTAQR